MRIFIIDDNQIDLLISRKLLLKNNASLEVQEYVQARQALAEIKTKQVEKPDIILLDLNMPEMDGWEFLEALREENADADLKVYVLTSSLDDRDRTKAKKYNVVEGYLTKPLNDSVIQNILA
ncbi:MAG: response regulator [Cyclobacteriaceae bacterium]